MKKEAKPRRETEKRDRETETAANERGHERVRAIWRGDRGVVRRNAGAVAMARKRLDRRAGAGRPVVRRWRRSRRTSRDNSWKRGSSSAATTSRESSG